MIWVFTFANMHKKEAVQMVVVRFEETKEMKQHKN